MNFAERIHFLIRAWRYRLRGEEFGISYLLSRDLANKTAVDIGANRGIYSYWMHRQVGAEGRVVAFEPQPELSNYLHELRDSFRLRKLEIANLGLSSKRGEMILRRPKHHWGGASYDRHDTQSETNDLITTQVTTLDEFFANPAAAPVSFIKCDVEGHELQVFRGGERILSNDRPELLFECSMALDPHCPVFAYLNNLDYEGYCFGPQGFAPICEFPALRLQMHKRARRDFVFVPKERSRALLRRCA